MNAEQRSQDIRLRRLEIAATLAEWKRDYIVHNIERPFGERVTLEAEDAALALEVRRLGSAVEAAKVERRKRLNASTLAQLVSMLNARGLSDLVAEAERRAAFAGPGPEETA